VSGALQLVRRLARSASNNRWGVWRRIETGEARLKQDDGHDGEYREYLTEEQRLQPGIADAAPGVGVEPERVACRMQPAFHHGLLRCGEGALL
jgi:hypothetical protein